VQQDTHHIPVSTSFAPRPASTVANSQHHRIRNSTSCTRPSIVEAPGPPASAFEVQDRSPRPKCSPKINCKTARCLQTCTKLPVALNLHQSGLSELSLNASLLCLFVPPLPPRPLSTAHPPLSTCFSLQLYCSSIIRALPALPTSVAFQSTHLSSSLSPTRACSVDIVRSLSPPSSHEPEPPASLSVPLHTSNLSHTLPVDIKYSSSALVDFFLAPGNYTPCPAAAGLRPLTV
jgi:hypothetical protein